MRAFRLTGRGWQILVVGGLTYGGARLFGTTQLYQLSFALLALLAAAFVLALLGGREIRLLRRGSGTRLMAGRESRIEIVVENGSRSPSPPLEITDRLPRRETFRVSRIKGRDRASISLPVRFERRGVYELGPAALHLTDPFRLVRMTRRLAGSSEVVVYPEVFELADFPLGSRRAEGSGARSRAVQRGDEFHGLREYRRGDDPRHIHWKSVARTGELMVKEFAASVPRSYTVALDMARRTRGGSGREVEDAVSAAASVLGYLNENRLEFRLLVSDAAASSTGFGEGYREAMELLARIRADGRERLTDLLNSRGERLGDGVVLVTRETGGPLVEAAHSLLRQGLTVSVVAVAAHTYRAMRAPDARMREAGFIATLGRLVQLGIPVRVIRRAEGVESGLNGTAMKGAG